ncbi:hypothetical protein A2Z22_02810 [Candidatus Woesebacteria bacterium RBG_16_34_12]|uniref:Uncharacterized protein n=1 Tax=Candidatus Woesebacteria bacterium RBG_16_34_12 TaxID=1802480 RepID=A0A1F7X6T9_9BACT|nr:MAG: hypothetical protein A2Z22_02810 [Candidatus Woesebacteria bacterium RBG_16_34_12]
MKRKIKIFSILFFIAVSIIIYLNLLPKLAYAQTPIPCPQIPGLQCDECYTLTPGYITLDSTLEQCDESGISYRINARLLQDFLYDAYLAIYRTSYNIEFQNNWREIVQTFGDNVIESMFDCELTGCHSGATFTFPIAFGSSNPQLYPGGLVYFYPTVNVVFRNEQYDNYFMCDVGTITVNDCVGNPCHCTFGQPIPPSGCTVPPLPTPICGSNGECLPTQICGDGSVCEISSQCHCNVNQAPGQCGGGGCPPTHYCYHNPISGQGDCIEDPENCHPCNDPPDQCGGDCNMLQRCVNGSCYFDIIYCDQYNRSGTPAPTYPPVRCDPIGNPPDSGVETAIGCIPVITETTQPFITWILRWSFGISGGISFILILYAGFQIITSAGNPRKLAASKELITAAIAGLLLLIFSVYVLDLLGVKILQLPGL